MPAAQRPWAAELLHFWFHELRPSDWFRRSAAVDAELERRFGRWLTTLGNRPVSDFLTDRHTARAAVLLFDQCPRNLYRDDARAFTFDPLARAICKASLERTWDRSSDA